MQRDRFGREPPRTPMANYIDNTILCETYVHIETYDLSKEAEQRIRDYLEAQIKFKSEYFFDTKIEWEIEVEEGSLTIRATVLGGLAAFLISTASFKGSVYTAVDSAKMFSESLMVDGIVAAKNKARTVDHKEARLGVPGRLKRLIARIEKLGYEIERLKEKAISAKAAEVRRETERLLEDIPEQKDRVVVCKGLLEVMADNFPKKLSNNPTQREISGNWFSKREEYGAIIVVLDQQRSQKESDRMDQFVKFMQALASIAALYFGYKTLQLHKQLASKSPEAARTQTDDGVRRAVRHIKVSRLSRVTERIQEKKDFLDRIMQDAARPDAFKVSALEDFRRWACKELGKMLEEANNAPALKEQLDPFWQEFRCT